MEETYEVRDNNALALKGSNPYVRQNSENRDNSERNNIIKQQMIAGSVAIELSDFQELLNSLQKARDNTERIELLGNGIEGKLFTAKQILLLLQSTPSIKTRKDMVYRLGPRISDLKNVGIVCDSFTQAADVQDIENMFRTISSLQLASKGRSTANKPIISAGRGRGRGGTNRRKDNAKDTPILEVVEDEEKEVPSRSDEESTTPSSTPFSLEKASVSTPTQDEGQAPVSTPTQDEEAIQETCVVAEEHAEAVEVASIPPATLAEEGRTTIHSTPVTPEEIVMSTFIEKEATVEPASVTVEEHVEVGQSTPADAIMSEEIAAHQEEVVPPPPPPLQPGETLDIIHKKQVLIAPPPLQPPIPKSTAISKTTAEVVVTPHPHSLSAKEEQRKEERGGAGRCSAEKYLPYEEIRRRMVAGNLQGLKPEALEGYLEDKEFAEVMKMSKEDFGKLAKWRQKKIKMDAKLF